jgi:hypothetical protein
MARYIRKVTALSPAPPPAARTQEPWVGYEFTWLAGDLSKLGLLPAETFTEQQLHDHGIVAFHVIPQSDKTTLRALGLYPTDSDA